MSKLNRAVGVAQVSINELQFHVLHGKEKQTEIPNEKQKISIRKMNETAPDGNSILIQAMLPMSEIRNGFSLSMQISGVFVVDKAFEKMIDAQDLNEDIKGLYSRLASIMANKFILVSSQFSLEVSNYPIVPNIRPQVGPNTIDASDDK